ncbi:MAG: hypothetical protein P8L41_03085 [Paracoccaceae bacterium]|nr:hypothetical protein [Paracoccaceae bacterium]
MTHQYHVSIAAVSRRSRCTLGANIAKGLISKPRTARPALLDTKAMRPIGTSTGLEGS